MNSDARSEMHDDRRRYVRISKSSLMECQEYSIPETAEKEVGLVSKNISAGGLLFETKTEYALGSVLRLEVSLSGWERYKPEFYKPESVTQHGPLVILGEVVRIEAISEGKYDIGVKITGIDEGHRLALEKFIKEEIRKLNYADTE